MSELTAEKIEEKTQIQTHTYDSQSLLMYYIFFIAFRAYWCVCVRAECEIMYWITRKANYLYYYMTIFAAFEYEYAYALYVP